MTDEIIAAHLRGTDRVRRKGPYICGVYPLLPDDTCRFLAADFDGDYWTADALAFMETCRINDVPAALERSRSGAGGHVCIFFPVPVAARDARLLGTILLTQAQERRPELGFSSYDRLFPSQDALPRGGFGNLIALPLQRRGRNVLVLVHRKELLTQLVERLRQFLSVSPDQIGLIGGGKRKPTGVIDVAVIQSLVRKGAVSDVVSRYGHLIVDECHHLPAVSFELVARRAKARYVLGLSATITRKDGHHPIIHMQCGPVRHRVDSRHHAA